MKLILQLILLIVLFFIPKVVDAQKFTLITDTASNLPRLYKAQIDFGDFDNNGTLDILMCGMNYSTSVTNVFSYNSVTTKFVEQSSIVLPIGDIGSSIYGDYDNDGLLDILLVGAKLYKNNGASTGGYTYTEQSNTGLPLMLKSKFDWGDFDNDGDLDILMSGYNYSMSVEAGTYVYVNNGNSKFVKLTTANLVPLIEGSVDWGDYDNDGWLDILVTGRNPDFQNRFRSIVYHNMKDGTFQEVISANLMGVGYGDASWGDYDQDGDLDILLCGKTNIYNVIAPKTAIYRNDGSYSFTLVTSTPSILGVENSSCDWGDFDGDGDLDFVVTGLNTSTYTKTGIYINNGYGGFSELTSDTLSGMEKGDVLWVDYDNDNDLDIVISGKTKSGPWSYIRTYIYRNDSATVNTPPTAPTGLTSNLVDTMLQFSWNPATDVASLSAGLNYNISIGSTSGGFDIKTPQSILSTGFRQLAVGGYINDTSTYLAGLINLNYGDTLYWKVQSIDAGKTGSPFSAEAMAIVPLRIEVSDDVIKNVNDTVIINVKNNSTTTLSYTWFPAIGLDNINVQSPHAFPTQTTTYYVTATDGNYSVSDSVVINIASFENVNVNSIDPVRGASIAVGDYDNDGDMDLLINGQGASGPRFTKLFRNESHFVFTEQNISIPILVGGVNWVDLNNDGLLDIIVFGNVTYNNSTASFKMYKNNGNNIFSIITNHGIPGFTLGDADFADFDADGDLDIVIMGKNSSSTPMVRIYKNNGNFSFSMVAQNFTGIADGDIDCGDYNNDGYPDILVSGYGPGRITQLYTNNASGISFSLMTGQSLIQVNGSSVAWSDYNNDGYLDFFIMGYNNSVHKTAIYTNNGPSSNGSWSFTELMGPDIGRGLNASWGDYDNDGWADLLVTSPFGNSGLYHNEQGNSFTKVDDFSILNGSSYDGNLWADFDNDGDLDFVHTGSTDGNTTGNFATIYQNNVINPNTAPTTPSGLVAYSNSSGIVFSWNPVIDSSYMSSQINYNIFIGTTPGNYNVKSIPVNLVDGFRRQPFNGAILDTSYYFACPNNLHNIPLYWTVQAVDQAYMGSAFAVEQTTHWHNTSGQINFSNMIPKCFGTTDSIRVSLTNHGVASITSAKLGLEINGQSQPDYNWSGSVGSNSSILLVLDTAYIASNSSTNQILVTLKEVNGNSSNFSTPNDSIYLNYQLLAIPTAQISSGSSILCAGASVKLNIAFNGAKPFVYAIDGLAPKIVNDTLDYVFVQPWNATWYKVIYLTDSNNCVSNNAFDSVYIDVHPNPTVLLGSDSSICINHQIQLDAGDGFIHYNWNIGDTTQIIALDSNKFSIGYNTYIVEVIDSNTCQNSDTLVLLVDPCTSISNLQEFNEEINIYPNPNNGTFNLQLKGRLGETCLIEIYDIKGKLILNKRYKLNNTKKMQIISFDISTYSKGIYLLKLQTEKGLSIKRLIIE